MGRIIGIDLGTTNSVVAVMIDNLFAAPPESHLACLDAAMTATEQGAGIIEQRGADWRAFHIPAVMNQGCATHRFFSTESF